MQAALSILCDRCIKHVKDCHTATTKPCPNSDRQCVFLYHLIKTTYCFWYYISAIFDCNFTTANKFNAECLTGSDSNIKMNMNNTKME